MCHHQLCRCIEHPIVILQENRHIQRKQTNKNKRLKGTKERSFKLKKTDGKTDKKLKKLVEEAESSSVHKMRARSKEEEE